MFAKLKKLNMKDWKGNTKTITCLGAHNDSEHEREVNDYYATSPVAIDYLLEVEDFSDLILEPACGEGHLSKRLEEFGKRVVSTDLIDRGFGIGGIDFFKDELIFGGDIITNPPYRFAKEFIQKSLETVHSGAKVAMFLRIQFLESKGRYEFFKNNPPKKIYVFSGRMGCAMNGEFGKHSVSAVPYAWYVWEKGYKGETVIDWILVNKN